MSTTELLYELLQLFFFPSLKICAKQFGLFMNSSFNIYIEELKQICFKLVPEYYSDTF